MAELNQVLLTKETIEGILDTLEHPHMRTKQGNILVKYTPEDYAYDDLEFVFSIEGESTNILRIYSVIAEDIPQVRLQQIYQICSEYHRTSYYGRAYLQRDDHSTIASYEASIKIPGWIAEDFLETYIETHLLSAENLQKLLSDSEALRQEAQPLLTNQNPVNRSVLEEAIKVLPANYTVSPDGIFAATMEAAEKNHYSLMIKLWINEENTNKVELTVTALNTIPRDAFGKAFFSVNKLILKASLGRIYLLFDEKQEEAIAQYYAVSEFRHDDTPTDVQLFITKAMNESFAVYNVMFYEDRVLSALWA